VWVPALMICILFLFLLIFLRVKISKKLIKIRLLRLFRVDKVNDDFGAHLTFIANKLFIC